MAQAKQNGSNSLRPQVTPRMGLGTSSVQIVDWRCSVPTEKAIIQIQREKSMSGLWRRKDPQGELRGEMATKDS